jgi:tetratricopeptide (TPR) repeat protein
MYFLLRRCCLRNSKVVLSARVLFCVWLLLSGCASLDKVKIVDIDPRAQKKEGVRPIMKEADQYYLVGEYQKAEAIYLKLVNQKTKDPLVFYRLGNIAFKKNEVKKAQGYYDASLQLMPNNSKAHFNISIVYLSLARQHLQNYGKGAPPETDLQTVEWMMGVIDQYLARSVGGGKQGNAAPAAPTGSFTAPASSSQPPAQTDSGESDPVKRQDSLDSLVKELQGL